MLDHLVYATPELEPTVEDLGLRLGVHPAPGGRHPGRGTRNELLSLGPGAYLEIIGPDADAPVLALPFGIDRLPEPALVAWAAAAAGIDERVQSARAAGYDPGPVTAMSRELPDGGVLQWRLTPFPGGPGASVVPFFIDWCSSAHPSTTSPPGCRLVSFHGEHPDPDGVRRQLQALGVELDLRRAPRPGLVAVVAGPAGTVELR
ncbi:MAG: VOC family protein [Acidimicrobiia bacterium]